MPIRKMWKIELGLIAVTGLVAGLHAQAPGAGGANRSTTGDKQSALVTQGKARFQAYKCYDCHGQNGEGTDEAPDLTHSKLTAEQVSKFLQKPSVDAQNKGMPDVPTDSPDHQPLVAYVMSLRAPGSASTGTSAAAKPGASTPPSKPATPKGATAAASGPASGPQSALVAQGKARFQAYKCYDCHGQNGEGTDDAPDLTHSKLTAEQVSKFLQKPSVDAQNKGMPDVPTSSPDHQPLVSYVMSLRAK
jgi:mono/diheme cytochrome c family protein